MTMREYAGWLAYDRISPIGGKRLDQLSAIVCSMIAASVGVKNPSPHRFMPQWNVAKGAQSEDEIRERMKHAVRLFERGNNRKTKRTTDG